MVKNITFLKLSCRKIVKLYFKIVPFETAQLAIDFLLTPSSTLRAPHTRHRRADTGNRRFRSKPS